MWHDGDRLKGEPLGISTVKDYRISCAMCAPATTPSCPATRLPFLIGDRAGRLGAPDARRRRWRACPAISSAADRVRR